MQLPEPFAARRGYMYAVFDHRRPVRIDDDVELYHIAHLAPPGIKQDSECFLLQREKDNALNSATQMPQHQVCLVYKRHAALSRHSLT